MRDKSFFYAIHDISRLMRREFDAAAQTHGLTMPQWRVIAELFREDGMSQVALAARIEASPMTVSGLLDRLETKGLVVREVDPADSRAKIVRVTETARELATRMKGVAEKLYKTAFVDISDAERANALNVLTMVSQNLSTSPILKENAE